MKSISGDNIRTQSFRVLVPKEVFDMQLVTRRVIQPACVVGVGLARVTKKDGPVDSVSFLDRLGALVEEDRISVERAMMEKRNRD
ncbi:hypothetical protein E3N88_31624 [Mikania micrantha]|uniref:Uncharacterized protein n=1 Tax=Mikania micrantha TaxID=192012 RepID=A0A5N6M628_9ASTR|nr:hypothetical protein E3N88_31624 [Mikania micrantha]